MARTEAFDFNRSLLYLLGCLVSFVSYLGNHAILKVETDAAENKISLQIERSDRLRSLDAIKDSLARAETKIESLEKQDALTAQLREDKTRRVGDTEGSVRGLQSVMQALSDRIARIEGHEDGRRK